MQKIAYGLICTVGVLLIAGYALHQQYKELPVVNVLVNGNRLKSAIPAVVLGFDPQYGGMDWQSLRLVFEEASGNWYLIGIIHDQWTI